MKIKIRIHLLILISLCNCILAFAQSPNWNWTKHPVGSDFDYSSCVSTDASGNVIMTGYFYGSTITFDTITLTNAGSASTDIFIVKYNSNGDVIWAKSAGGTHEDEGFTISSDSIGNIFISGYIVGPATFDSIILPNTGIFIAKYDSSGTLIWAKGTKSGYNDLASNSASDSNGNLILTGFFKSDSLTFDTITLINSGINTLDIFILKYDPNGNLLWAKSEGSLDDDAPSSICVDANGNIFTTGVFDSPTISFGSITLTGLRDIFLVKYDQNGNVLWAKSEGGNEADISSNIRLDRKGDIIISGNFYSPTITFGTSTLTNSSTNNADLFIVKYDSSGNALWANQVNGSLIDYCNAMSIDNIGNIYIAGSFNSPNLNFGSTSLTNSNLNYHDIFIAEYDTIGNFAWAQSAGGSSSESIMSASCDYNGNLIVTGYFMSPTLILGIDTLINYGNYDIFISKIGLAPLAINKVTNCSKVTFAPNPFTSSSKIIFNETQNNATIIISDEYGRFLKSIRFNGKQFTIERGDLKSGVYILQIIDDKKNKVMRKIIIL